MQSQVPAQASLPFSYDEFSEWFDKHAERSLEPAKEAATMALNEHLDAELLEPQRVRIRVASRVKSKARTWKKLNDKYPNRVSSIAGIPDVIDDLVGLRVVCTNKSDVDRLVEVLESLEQYSDGDHPVLATHPESTKDWRDSPKESGYRAYHLNLCTSVAHATRRHPVVCELQIRTLLQDSWGELTHEDTYKPGAEVPPLVDTLSRRMADLMATLDDIAEDLRSELDRLADDALDSGTETEELSRPENQDENPTREAAEAYLSERVAGLSQPVALPTLAWEVQREFGREISNGWVGYGAFKKMLDAVCPDAQMSPTPPFWILPAEFDISSYETRPGVPRVVSLLKDADRSFPLVHTERWPQIYETLAKATQQLTWPGQADAKTLNELTRIGRDTSLSETKDHVSRGQLHYVAFGLMLFGKLQPEMAKETIEDHFVSWILTRSADMGVPTEDSDQLESWVRGHWGP